MSNANNNNYRSVPRPLKTLCALAFRQHILENESVTLTEVLSEDVRHQIAFCLQLPQSSNKFNASPLAWRKTGPHLDVMQTMEMLLIHLLSPVGSFPLRDFSLYLHDVSPFAIENKLHSPSFPVAPSSIDVSPRDFKFLTQGDWRDWPVSFERVTSIYLYVHRTDRHLDVLSKLAELTRETVVELDILSDIFEREILTFVLSFPKLVRLKIRFQGKFTDPQWLAMNDFHLTDGEEKYGFFNSEYMISKKLKALEFFMDTTSVAPRFLPYFVRDIMRDRADSIEKFVTDCGWPSSEFQPTKILKKLRDFRWLKPLPCDFFAGHESDIVQALDHLNPTRIRVLQLCLGLHREYVSQKLSRIRLPKLRKLKLLTNDLEELLDFSTEEGSILRSSPSNFPRLSRIFLFYHTFDLTSQQQQQQHGRAGGSPFEKCMKKFSSLRSLKLEMDRFGFPLGFSNSILPQFSVSSNFFSFPRIPTLEKITLKMPMSTFRHECGQAAMLACFAFISCPNLHSVRLDVGQSRLKKAELDLDYYYRCGFMISSRLEHFRKTTGLCVEFHDYSFSRLSSSWDIANNEMEEGELSF
jgi:hypothetical protein